MRLATKGATAWISSAKGSWAGAVRRAAVRRRYAFRRHDGPQYDESTLPAVPARASDLPFGGRHGQGGDDDPAGAAPGLDAQAGEERVRTERGGQGGVVQDHGQVPATPPC